MEHYKNSAVNVSDERAIDAFTLGLRRGYLVDEMGRIKPRIVSDLMDIANRFVDGKTLVTIKGRGHHRGNKYSSQRRRSRNYDNYGSHSQVAAGYKDVISWRRA
jgi:hypothetical protein